VARRAGRQWPILLAIPVSTLAAQLSGSQLVIATGNQLRVYNTNGANLSATWNESLPRLVSGKVRALISGNRAAA